MAGETCSLSDAYFYPIYFESMSVCLNISNFAIMYIDFLCLGRAAVCDCGTPWTFLFITKTRLYKFDPLQPHLYIVELGFTGVYIIFLISAQKHRLWVLVRTASARRF